MTITLSGEDFNDFYYKHDCGIPYERNDHWLNFFDKIANRIVETLHPQKVLDAGCAWGFLVEALRNKGVEAYGIDISEYAISNVIEPVKSFCKVASISEPFDRSYDLIVSIEVLEHMTPEEALKAIDNFCTHSDRVLFSSTPFDYKEVTHVNVQFPEYWARKFSIHGFYRDMDYDASYITAWATLFTKRQLTPDRLVFEYERSHWPLRKENYDLRQHIAESQSYIEATEAKHETAILETQHYLNLMAIDKSLLTAKDAEIELLKNTIATNESLASAKDAEIESLKNTIAINEARLQEINAHWHALVNSTTWKTLKKLGKFKDFPDLMTRISQNSLQKRPSANPGGAEQTEEQCYAVSSAYLPDLPSTIKEKMVHRFGYSLEPLSGVRLLGEVGHFVSLDQDPQLILELTNGKVKSGWMNLTLLLELPENHSDTVFYFDNGQGFKESNKTTIPLFNNELTETQFEIPTGTKRIRFDPCDCTGEFRIKVFNLKPISQISLLRKAIKSSTRNITSIQSLVSITKKGYSLLKTGGLNALAEKIYDPSSESYTLWVKRYDTLNEADRFAIKKSVSTFTYTPLISVVMPTYNTQEKWLRAAIESVQAQLYENWELCIADDCSADENVRKIIKECAAEDSRIKYVFREVNGHISAASNSALSIATGEFVALLDHDDLLAETALYRVAQALNQNPSYDIIYSDEDKVDEDNCRYDPYFKPDWNPDLLVAQNYLSHLSIIRKSMLNEFGGFRVGFEGSQDWDMALRITRSAPANSIIHIPYILYHWRAVPGSTAKAVDQKAYITESQYKTIESHFKALQIPVEIKQNEINYWNVNYPIPDPQPLVSIIIPTKNQKVLLEKCINSIVTKTDYSNYEIIVIDNHSDEDEAKTYLRSILANPIIKVLEFKENFNFSRINNYAVSQAKGDLIVFMNNDIEILANDWLIEMLSLAIRDGTGAVGAKLLYPNKTIQHAGVILGVGGVANHAYLGAPADVVGQMGRARIVQNMSAVTAACLVVEKKKFLEVGGFNEIDLKIAFNDVDFCLKLLKAGYRNVWTPNSVFIHHESISRGQEDTPAKQARFASEVQYMLDNWKDILVNDPAYNPNLSIQRADFSLAFPPRVSRV